MEKKDLLKEVVKHVDIKQIDSTQIIDAMRDMSFSSRDTANAADIFQRMMNDKEQIDVLARLIEEGATLSYEEWKRGVKRPSAVCIAEHLISCGVTIGGAE